MAKSRIIKELANNEISMDIAFQRLLIIASDIDNAELSAWAEAELHGYNSPNEIPPYRNVQSTSFIYSGINGSFKVQNSPFTWLSIIRKYSKDAFDVPVMDSIATLQYFIGNNKTSAYCRDFSMLSGKVYEQTGVQCTQILQQVPINYIQNIMSQIKTLLLRILLKLDKEYGSLDDLDIDTSNKTKEEIDKINQSINNYIYIDNSISMGDENTIDSSSLGVSYQ